MLICGFQRLMGQSQRWWVEVVDGSQRGSLLLFFFFSFFWFMGAGSVIRGGHRWCSPTWEASLASLLA